MKIILILSILLSLSFVYSQEPVPQIDVKNTHVEPNKWQGNIATELEEFINFFAKTAEKSIVYDSSIKGRKIFIQNAQWKNVEELQTLFLAVLELNGYFAESVGKQNQILKIKRNIVAPWTQNPIISSLEELESICHEDRYITFIFQVQNTKPSDVLNMIRNLRIINPQGGNLGLVESRIFISDYAPNVWRTVQAIKLLDVAEKKK